MRTKNEKIKNVRSRFTAPIHLLLAVFVISFFTTNCSEDPQKEFDEMAESYFKATSVSIPNAGFESSWSNWTDVDPSSISSMANSGSKSAKITGAGGGFSQNIGVSPNTNYSLSAYVSGGWRFGVRVSGTKKTRSGSASSWKKETVTFNSGSASTVTILAEYKSGDGRYDDFSLVAEGAGGGTTTSQAPIGKTIWLKASNGKYVCAEKSVANNPVEADRTNLGAWEKFDVVDAGGGQIGLKAQSNNKYVCAELYVTNNPLRANRSAVGAWEKFLWEDLGNGQVALKANSNGKYVQARTDISQNPLQARGTSAQSMAIFTWGIVSDNPGGGGGGASGYPSSVLDLGYWEETLPIPQSSSQPNNPKDVYQPELNTYKHDTYFHLNSAGDGVVFRAHCGGTTTSGSSYPRSELREMNPGYSGSSGKASWSTSSGTHTMFIKQAITHLPDVKKHVVCGQIHDSNDDVIVFRLENKKLFIDENGKDGPVLTSNYNLGDVFTVKFVAENGGVKCYYNNSYVYTYSKNTSGCYFKAGCYTQSNTSKGDQPSAYGEVIIYDLWVSHN